MFFIKTDKNYVPGCPSEPGGLIWLSPAVRGPMLAMMSQTSGFYFMTNFMMSLIIVTMMTIRAPCRR